MKKNPSLQDFFKAVLSLNTLEECELFFDDICTIQETEAIAQRFEVALLLCEGKSYNDITRLTGASSTTIGRVSKCLNYGNGGYKAAIQRIKENADN